METSLLHTLNSGFSLSTHFNSGPVVCKTLNYGINNADNLFTLIVYSSFFSRNAWQTGVKNYQEEPAYEEDEIVQSIVPELMFFPKE